MGGPLHAKVNISAIGVEPPRPGIEKLVDVTNNIKPNHQPNKQNHLTEYSIRMFILSVLVH